MDYVEEFDKLKTKDKETIENLIMYFNKQE